MKRVLLILGACVTVAQAHDIITTPITFDREIIRILYDRCNSCHHPDGKAFSLMTYSDARPWAVAIKEEVLARRMPPWGAVKGFGQFRNDESLADPEIEMLVLWVEGGAPKGDDIYLPPVPAFPAVSKSPTPSRGITVRGEMSLDHPITASGIAPREMPPGAAMQILARLPDGTVENLLWLRNTLSEWNRAFYFRQPIMLPKGTLIAVRSEAPAVILTGEPHTESKRSKKDR